MRNSPTLETPESEELLGKVPAAYTALQEHIHERIVGLDQVLELLLAGIFSSGHVLLVGVPGLAKTLLVSTLAELLDLSFSRIQFTPDLMPSDIIGTEVISEDSSTGERDFRFMTGPIFCNILLADEINRTPPKTQAALMEAMEEQQVTTAGTRHPLAPPFFVLATQNPIEQEGTYPLPAAQLDRFTFLVKVDYPSRIEERRIVRMTTAPHLFHAQKVLSRDEILALCHAIASLPAPPEVVQLATHLVRLTRPAQPEVPEAVRRFLAWGVGPRAGQALVQTAKVRALLHGRRRPGREDIVALAPHVFRHRMVMNFQGTAENVTPEEVLAEVLAAAELSGPRAAAG